ncbi:histidine kinase [Pseudoflavitalea sp. X16]|uniref:sensor histidine kinase n=1 Tax=Paraflavitalea devenefica TaxID=2716334 RepID=UPI00142274A5|nr:histidine kinase [Paraflavitalea devenefica]NII25969.1 histidine kinase [Paraflavitalea devenefica]
MKVWNKAGNGRSDSNTQHLWLILAAGIPIFLTADFYVSALMNRNSEQIAFLITIYILIGVYIGRYVSQIWINKYRVVPRWIFILFIVLMLACTIIVFIVAGLTITGSKHFMGFLFLGLPLLILSISTGILIKLVRTTVKNQLQDARVTAEQSQSELKLLQSQLSPHFLFNTLNNIYGISLSRHENVPPLLLKLSDLLRYSVYDAREQFVPLVNELEYMHNYIDFEKIRIGEKLQLVTELEYHIDPKIKIAPLLLIVFIENAFKHAKNTTEQEVFIDIKLKIWGKKILFAVKNSSNGVRDEKSILGNNSGFGLDNVTKRLELLYPREHDLQIIEEDGFYSVMLQLKVK